MTKIPKLVHLIWMGDAEIPSNYVEWNSLWSEINPDFEVRIWGNEEINSLYPFRGEEFVFSAKDTVSKVDVIRFEILRRFGGISADMDMKVLRPFPEYLLEEEVFLSFQSLNLSCCALMGCVPFHPFFQSAMDCIHGWRLCKLPFDADLKSLYVENIRLKLFPEIVSLPPEIFHPSLKFDEDGVLLTSPENYPNSITLHTWDNLGR